MLTSPQVFDNYAVTVMIGDDPYTLGLFDTAGGWLHLNVVLFIMLTFYVYRTGRL
jgi:hypothetical protein